MIKVKRKGYIMPMKKGMFQARIVVTKEEYDEFKRCAKLEKRSFSNWALTACRERACSPIYFASPVRISR